MSTKFAIRPAVRKRPWLCKRSPPCLIPPPVPKNFNCSFDIQPVSPNPAAYGIAGSLLLERVLTTNVFYGIIVVGPAPSDYFECWFTYAEPAFSWCAWQADLVFDTGSTITTFVGQSPSMNYEAFDAYPTAQPWTFRLFING